MCKYVCILKLLNVGIKAIKTSSSIWQLIALRIFLFRKQSDIDQQLEKLLALKDNRQLVGEFISIIKED